MSGHEVGERWWWWQMENGGRYCLVEIIPLFDP